MSPRARVGAGYGLAAVLVAAGALVAGSAPSPSDYGWFAYEPLPDTVDIADPRLRHRMLLGAASLLFAGLLMAAATTGWWLLGRHRRGHG